MILKKCYIQSTAASPLIFPYTHYMPWAKVEDSYGLFRRTYKHVYKRTTELEEELFFLQDEMRGASGDQRVSYVLIIGGVSNIVQFLFGQ